MNRSRLERATFLLFHVNPETLGRFFENAPNLRSFIGTNVFRLVADPIHMSREEIAERLNQLRNHYQLTDQQVLQRARDGSLPADPEFAEWSVLLGSREFV